MDDPRSNMEFDHGRVEARSVAFTDVDASTDGSTFTGYAAVFDHEADLGDFTESISRGAFRKAIGASGNIPMLYDHNPGLPVLATTGAGTLKLKEDGKGLRVEANVARHFIGDAVREMVSRGDIRGMSFGFVAGAGNSKVESRGVKPHRTLIGFKRLLDVSPTWDEAYSGTSAEFRSLRALQIAEDIEQAQQLLTGAVPPLEDGAPAGSTAEPGESTAEQDPHCEKCDQPLGDGEHVCGETEQRSGATTADWKAAAAARSRRLQILGLDV